MDLPLLHFSSGEIEQFCLKHHIRRLSFFGSVVRDDFRPDSDVDVLVEFETGHVPGFGFFTIETELSSLIGRKVDLQTPGFLSPEIRCHAFSDVVTAYEKAPR